VHWAPSTITLTMDRYSHTVLGEQSEAIELLPSLAGAAVEALRATGTDNATSTNGKSVLASSLAERGAVKPATNEPASDAQDTDVSGPDSVLAFSDEKLAVNPTFAESQNGVVEATAGDDKTP
jgi:hypothetical protein